MSGPTLEGLARELIDRAWETEDDTETHAVGPTACPTCAASDRAVAGAAPTSEARGVRRPRCRIATGAKRSGGAHASKHSEVFARLKGRPGGGVDDLAGVPGIRQEASA